MNDEIISKWEKTGLLEINGKMSLVKKEKLALLLEEMCNIILSKMDILKEISTTIKYDDMIPAMALPVVVRLFIKNPHKMPDMEWLFYNFLQYVKDNYEKYKNDCVNGIDGEAEMCCLYTDVYFKNI